MKTKILLVFCLSQIVLISVFGQPILEKGSNSVTIGWGNSATTIDLPSHSTSSRTYSSSGNSLNNLGGQLGTALGNLLGALIFGSINSNPPAPIYYDSRGIPYPSAKAAAKANEKYEKEKRFTLEKEDAAKNWKGGMPVQNSLAFRGQRPTLDAMEFKVIGQKNTNSTELADYGMKKYLDALNPHCRPSGWKQV